MVVSKKIIRKVVKKKDTTKPQQQEDEQWCQNKFLNLLHDNFHKMSQQLQNNDTKEITDLKQQQMLKLEQLLDKNSDQFDSKQIKQFQQIFNSLSVPNKQNLPRKLIYNKEKTLNLAFYISNSIPDVIYRLQFCMIINDKLQILCDDALIDCTNNYAVYIPIPVHRANKDILIIVSTIQKSTKRLMKVYKQQINVFQDRLQPIIQQKTKTTKSNQKQNSLFNSATESSISIVNEDSQINQLQDSDMVQSSRWTTDNQINNIQNFLQNQYLFYNNNIRIITPYNAIQFHVGPIKINSTILNYGYYKFQEKSLCILQDALLIDTITSQGTFNQQIQNDYEEFWAALEKEEKLFTTQDDLGQTYQQNPMYNKFEYQARIMQQQQELAQLFSIERTVQTCLLNELDNVKTQKNIRIFCKELSIYKNIQESNQYSQIVINKQEQNKLYILVKTISVPKEGNYRIIFKTELPQIYNNQLNVQYQFNDQIVNDQKTNIYQSNIMQLKQGINDINIQLSLEIPIKDVLEGKNPVKIAIQSQEDIINDTPIIYSQLKSFQYLQDMQIPTINQNIQFKTQQCTLYIYQQIQSIYIPPNKEYTTIYNSLSQLYENNQLTSKYVNQQLLINLKRIQDYQIFPQFLLLNSIYIIQTIIDVAIQVSYIDNENDIKYQAEHQNDAYITSDEEENGFISQQQLIIRNKRKQPQRRIILEILKKIIIGIDQMYNINFQELQIDYQKVFQNTNIQKEDLYQSSSYSDSQSQELNTTQQNNQNQVSRGLKQHENQTLTICSLPFYDQQDQYSGQFLSPRIILSQYLTFKSDKDMFMFSSAFIKQLQRNESFIEASDFFLNILINNQNVQKTNQMQVDVSTHIRQVVSQITNQCINYYINDNNYTQSQILLYSINYKLGKIINILSNYLSDNIISDCIILFYSKVQKYENEAEMFEDSYNTFLIPFLYGLLCNNQLIKYQYNKTIRNIIDLISWPINSQNEIKFINFPATLSIFLARIYEQNQEYQTYLEIIMKTILKNNQLIFIDNLQQGQYFQKYQIYLLYNIVLFLFNNQEFTQNNIKYVIQTLQIFDNQYYDFVNIDLVSVDKADKYQQEKYNLSKELRKILQKQEADISVVHKVNINDIIKILSVIFFNQNEQILQSQIIQTEINQDEGQIEDCDSKTNQQDLYIQTLNTKLMSLLQKLMLQLCIKIINYPQIQKNNIKIVQLFSNYVQKWDFTNSYTNIIQYLDEMYQSIIKNYQDQQLYTILFNSYIKFINQYNLQKEFIEKYSNLFISWLKQIQDAQKLQILSILNQDDLIQFNYNIIQGNNSIQFQQYYNMCKAQLLAQTQDITDQRLNRMSDDMFVLLQIKNYQNTGDINILYNLAKYYKRIGRREQALVYLDHTQFSKQIQYITETFIGIFIDLKQFPKCTEKQNNQLIQLRASFTSLYQQHFYLESQQFIKIYLQYENNMPQQEKENFTKQIDYIDQLLQSQSGQLNSYYYKIKFQGEDLEDNNVEYIYCFNSGMRLQEVKQYFIKQFQTLFDQNKLQFTVNGQPSPTQRPSNALQHSTKSCDALDIKSSDIKSDTKSDDKQYQSQLQDVNAQQSTQELSKASSTLQTQCQGQSDQQREQNNQSGVTDNTYNNISNKMPQQAQNQSNDTNSTLNNAHDQVQSHQSSQMQEQCHTSMDNQILEQNHTHKQAHNSIQGHNALNNSVQEQGNTYDQIQEQVGSQVGSHMHTTAPSASVPTPPPAPLNPGSYPCVEAPCVSDPSIGVPGVSGAPQNVIDIQPVKPIPLYTHTEQYLDSNCHFSTSFEHQYHFQLEPEQYIDQQFYKIFHFTKIKFYSQKHKNQEFIGKEVKQFVIQDFLPNIFYRSRVFNENQLEINPIKSNILEILQVQDKIHKMLTNQRNQDIQLILMQLQGVICPQVNCGIEYLVKRYIRDPSDEVQEFLTRNDINMFKRVVKQLLISLQNLLELAQRIGARKYKQSIQILSEKFEQLKNNIKSYLNE